jgi:hypothetical protein
MIMGNSFDSPIVLAGQGSRLDRQHSGLDHNRDHIFMVYGTMHMRSIM